MTWNFYILKSELPFDEQVTEWGSQVIEIRVRYFPEQEFTGDWNKDLLIDCLKT